MLNSNYKPNLLNSTQLTEWTAWRDSVLQDAFEPIALELNRLLGSTADWNREVFANFDLSRQLSHIHENKEHDFTGTSALSGKQFTITAFSPQTLELLGQLYEVQRDIEHTMENARVTSKLRSRPVFS